MKRTPKIPAAAANLAAASPSASKNVAERLGHPRDARLLVIHADDYGAMHSINRATEEALINGWVTSASVLVPSPWFPEVVRFAHQHPEADLGVHLALNSEWHPYRWGPVSPRAAVPSLVDSDDFLPISEGEVLERADPVEAEREFRAQIDRAARAGIPISHFDTHLSTIFHSPTLFAAYFRVGQAYSMPVLQEQRPNYPGVEPPPLATLVDRVVQMAAGIPARQWTSEYQRMLTGLPPGVFQLLVHVGFDDEELRGATRGYVDWDGAWRQRDFDTLRSPAFRRSLEDQGFILVNWRQLAKALPAEPKLRPGRPC